MKRKASELCRVCTGPEDVLFLIPGESWLCRSHGLELLDERESKLTYSPNLNTSITEQRMLDETRVWKAKLKSASDLRKP